ncbi:carboxypeptidase regulatory-like domain-containing protein [Amycolatopsis sp.]|uniref:carboxypeptidase regulatory-like domain-containing protein n=1 Tax=Amycolatopsis sp. TaxID=37632 RepID=UPI002BBF0540|nr:carboxypeptidase regulatory-like domain-containing protein [Amycolatopsis sp.]HVV13987.1 carboxypeptidase regulatory-like domain-containing protein [Amycolatopsis sp.]
MADQVETATEKKPSTVRTLAESLWFPLFFACGFLVCYLLAFHSPTPHHVEIAVSDPAAATQLQAALDKASPGGFDIEPAASADAARQAVLDRDSTAGYDATTGTLFVAKADGYMLETVLNQVFTPIAAQSGLTLHSVDLAPTASGDAMGTGMFYLVLVWNIPSYIVVMMMLRAVTLSRRAKLFTLVGWGAVLSVIGFAGGVALHVIPANPLAIPLAFLLSIGISLTSFGLVPFAKQFFPGVAMGLFVLLSMPSSGGAIPIQMVPGFFRALHPFMPMGNLMEALRGIFYFNGVGVLRPILVLCAWVLVGVALIAGHSLWQRRKAGTAEAVEEPPVEDPAIEMPRPTALPAHAHHFGEQMPVVSGAVRTLAGEAVRGAVITITDGKGQQLVRAVTGADGEYAVAGLPDQFVDLVVSASGLHSAVRRMHVREGVTRREDFELASRRQPVATLSGA